MTPMDPAGLYFSSPHPPALDLPHIITALDADLIGQVSHLTKSRPGLWNIPAPFDENDQFDNTRERAPLSWWALPLNQAEVQGLRWHVAEAVFGTKLMFLDSAANEAVLGELALLAGKRLETGAFVTDGYEDLPALSALLHQIGWALIPIGPERGKALFITRRPHAAWVNQLRGWTDHHGRNSATLREQRGALTIDEQTAPAKAREKAMAHRIDHFLGEMETFYGEANAALVPALEQRLHARQQLRRRIAQAKQSTRSS
jgi:hypothetical protein